jgi:hypothetical protein
MSSNIANVLYGEYVKVHQRNATIIQSSQARNRSLGQDIGFLPHEVDQLEPFAELLLGSSSIENLLREKAAAGNGRGDLTSWLKKAVTDKVIGQLQADLVERVRNAVAHGNLSQLETGKGLGVKYSETKADDYANVHIFKDLHALKIVFNDLFKAYPTTQFINENS